MIHIFVKVTAEGGFFSGCDECIEEEVCLWRCCKYECREWGVECPSVSGWG